MHSRPIFKKCKSDQVTLQVKLPLYSEWNSDPGSQGPAWPGPDCVSGLQSCRRPSVARPQPSSRPAFSWTCRAHLQLRAAVEASPLGWGAALPGSSSSLGWLPQIIQSPVLLTAAQAFLENLIRRNPRLFQASLSPYCLTEFHLPLSKLLYLFNGLLTRCLCSTVAGSKFHSLLYP